MLHRVNRGITCELGTSGTQGDSVPDSVGSLVEVECVSIFSSCAVVTGRLCLCAFESGQRVRWRFIAGRGHFELWVSFARIAPH